MKRCASMENQSKIVEPMRPTQTVSIVDNFIFEIDGASLSKLKGITNKLKFICNDIDPYNAKNIGPESTQILEEFLLTETLCNPFTYTNNLLRIMDLAENELNKRLH